MNEAEVLERPSRVDTNALGLVHVACTCQMNFFNDEWMHTPITAACGDKVDSASTRNSIDMDEICVLCEVVLDSPCMLCQCDRVH